MYIFFSQHWELWYGGSSARYTRAQDRQPILPRLQMRDRVCFAARRRRLVRSIPQDLKNVLAVIRTYVFRLSFYISLWCISFSFFFIYKFLFFFWFYFAVKLRCIMMTFLRDWFWWKRGNLIVECVFICVREITRSRSTTLYGRTQTGGSWIFFSLLYIFFFFIIIISCDTKRVWYFKFKLDKYFWICSSIIDLSTRRQKRISVIFPT